MLLGGKWELEIGNWKLETGNWKLETSVLSQKLADKVFPFRWSFHSAGRGVIPRTQDQGASPGGRSPHPVPQSGTPLSRAARRPKAVTIARLRRGFGPQGGRERGRGRGRVLLPTADAVGYPLSPVS